VGERDILLLALTTEENKKTKCLSW